MEFWSHILHTYISTQCTIVTGYRLPYFSASECPLVKLQVCKKCKCNSFRTKTKIWLSSERGAHNCWFWESIKKVDTISNTCAGHLSEYCYITLRMQNIFDLHCSSFNVIFGLILQPLRFSFFILIYDMSMSKHIRFWWHIPSESRVYCTS